jgi:uncharacterized protein YbjQ (UPF0145 family)
VNLEKSGNDMQKLIGLLLGAVVNSPGQHSELLQRLQDISGGEAQIVAELARVSVFF